jgi:hypothetical protein
MKPIIALLILGSIVTSASAAGTDIRGLVDGETGHADAKTSVMVAKR